MARDTVDGGLRQAEHPGIAFRDGPAGRRAGSACGSDVWEVVRALRELDGARTLRRAYTQKIDAQVAAADVASSEAEMEWRNNYPDPV